MNKPRALIPSTELAGVLCRVRDRLEAHFREWLGAPDGIEHGRQVRMYGAGSRRG